MRFHVSLSMLLWGGIAGGFDDHPVNAGPDGNFQGQTLNILDGMIWYCIIPILFQSPNISPCFHMWTHSTISVGSIKYQLVRWLKVKTVRYPSSSPLPNTVKVGRCGRPKSDLFGPSNYQILQLQGSNGWELGKLLWCFFADVSKIDHLKPNRDLLRGIWTSRSTTGWSLIFLYAVWGCMFAPSYILVSWGYNPIAGSLLGLQD